MKALITGISGQDGSYLAELLLSKGYEVYGVVRRVAQDYRLWRIQHLLKDIVLYSGSVENYASIFEIIRSVKPDEIYHLAAQSFVADSFLDEFTTMKINNVGTHNILAANRVISKAKFYFAASSEMFGNVLETPQKETTPFNPRSTYGISKCTGFYLAKHFREAYGIFACSGILFNHESPRRGLEFVTRKITSSVANIFYGREKKLLLGNMDAKRDWGHSEDYVEAMWMMLQHDKPDDYVVATGETNSVDTFCKLAFQEAGLNYKDYVEVSEQFKRPSDVELLVGDSSKIRNTLGWSPKHSLESLISEMVKSDLETFKF